MTIKGTQEFVSIFKKITADHVKMYSGSADVSGWGSKDFDVSELLNELSKTDSILLYGVVKKAYDIIKSYQRTYTIYNLTRGDYYRAALVDRPKDNLILDLTMNNLNKVYDRLQAELSSKVINGQ